jgi:hypothetical protein
VTLNLALSLSISYLSLRLAQRMVMQAMGAVRHGVGRWMITTYSQLAFMLAGMILSGGRVGRYVVFLGQLSSRLAGEDACHHSVPCVPRGRSHFVPWMGASAIMFAVTVGIACVLRDSHGSQIQVMGAQERRESEAALLRVLRLIEGVPNGRLAAKELTFTREALCYLDTVLKVHTKVRAEMDSDSHVCVELVIARVPGGGGRHPGHWRPCKENEGHR